MARTWKWPRNPSTVLHHLLWISIVIGLIPTLMLSLFAVMQNSRSYRKEMEITYRQHLRSIVTSANYWMTHVYGATIDQIVLNNTVQRALTYGFSTEYPYQNACALSQEVGKYLRRGSSNLSLEDCMVYSSRDEMPLYGFKVTMLSEVTHEPWFTAYQSMGGNFLYYWKKMANPLTQADYPTLSLIQPIVGTDFSSAYYRQTLGVAKLDIRLDSLFSSLLSQSNGKKRPYALAAWNESGQLLYLSDNAYAQALTPALVDAALTLRGTGYDIRLETGAAYLLADALSTCGVHVMMLFPQASALRTALNVVGTTLALMTVSILFVLLFSSLSIGRFAARLRRLLQKMERVESGDFTVRQESIGGQDELAVIDEHFNRMVERLDQTINTSYVAQLETLDAQLCALQLQINPHFLYNTLETISAIAVTHGLPIVSHMLEKLGEMFRYAVNRDSREQVTVREELRHVENYVFLQKMRFPAQFEVYYSIAPEIEPLRIPFFILQPIVENAILHGMKESEGQGSIALSAEREGDDLCFLVEDDGVGMSAEQLDALRQSMEDFHAHSKGIGLKNVHMRLRLVYGAPYGVQVESTLYKGTAVTVRIPLAPTHDEASPCIIAAERRDPPVTPTHRR